MRAPTPVQKGGPRVNEDIRNLEIQLIDQDGKNHGVVKTPTAIQMAADAGFDLVEAMNTAGERIDWQLQQPDHWLYYICRLATPLPDNNSS